MGCQDDGSPSLSRVGQDLHEVLFGLIVQPSGGLIQEQDRWIRGEDNSQGQRQPAAFGQVRWVARCLNPRGNRCQHGRGGSRGETGIAIGLATFQVHGFGVEQVAGLLWHQSNAGDQVLRLQGCGINTEHPNGALERSAQSHHGRKHR